jgi:DNA repair exonuclease SbcCD nuclease subunit
MSSRPFCFVHAADFHLELPPLGVSEVPDHLRELFLQSAYWAAERVFETVLSEEAELLILSGDILDPRHSGPRGPLFLVEQFERLAKHEVAVYWAGGRVDSPDAWPPDVWPSSIRLPQNVHVFARGRPRECIHRREETPLVRLIGASRAGRGKVRVADFDRKPSGLFTIAVAHGRADAAAFPARGIDYWALGGRHNRCSLPDSSQIVHYPGSPQGRRPEEFGPHGCTLVHVDDEQRARASLAPTDVMRWHGERIVVDEATTRQELETLLRERMRSLIEASPKTDLLISWTVAGLGPVVSELRRGKLAVELLGALREEYGFGPPARWSVSLSTEPAAALPSEWYEQQTIRGDFLRIVHEYQEHSDEPLELESYLSEEQVAGALQAVADVTDKAIRARVLREAAMLGVDLLSGEEPTQ